MDYSKGVLIADMETVKTYTLLLKSRENLFITNGMTNFDKYRIQGKGFFNQLCNDYEKAECIRDRLKEINFQAYGHGYVASVELHIGESMYNILKDTILECHDLKIVDGQNDTYPHILPREVDLNSIMSNLLSKLENLDFEEKEEEKYFGNKYYRDYSEHDKDFIVLSLSLIKRLKNRIKLLD